MFRYATLLSYNPYYWNPFAGMFAWNSGWQVFADEMVSYGYLIVLMIAMLRERVVMPYLAPICFLVFCKFHSNVQFWYFLLLPSFLLTIPNARLRFVLIAFCRLLDVRGSSELFFGPYDQRTFHGLASVFSAYQPK